VNDGVRGRDRKEDGHKSYLVGNIAPLWQLSVTAPPPVGKRTENGFLKAGMHEKQHRVNACNKTSQDVREKMKLLRR